MAWHPFFFCSIFKVIVVMMSLTMMILSKCAMLTGSSSYSQMMGILGGTSWGKVTAMCQTCICFGVCLTMIVVIGDQLDRRKL